MLTFYHYAVLAMMMIIFAYHSQKRATKSNKHDGQERAVDFLEAAQTVKRCHKTSKKKVAKAKDLLRKAVQEAHPDWTIQLRQHLDHYVLHPEAYGNVAQSLERLQAQYDANLTSNASTLLDAMDDFLGSSTDREAKWSDFYCEIFLDISRALQQQQRREKLLERWNYWVHMSCGCLESLSTTLSLVNEVFLSSSSSGSDDGITLNDLTGTSDDTVARRRSSRSEGEASTSDLDMASYSSTTLDTHLTQESSEYSHELV